MDRMYYRVPSVRDQRFEVGLEASFTEPDRMACQGRRSKWTRQQRSYDRQFRGWWLWGWDFLVGIWAL